MNNFPPTLDATDLARLLKKSVATILRDVSRSPENLPPFVKVGKKTIWITQVVWNWLAGRSSEPLKIEISFAPTSMPSANRPPAIPSLAEMLSSTSGSAR